jgi:hypothetical protein
MLSNVPHWIVDNQRYTNQFQTWQAVQRTGQTARFCLYEDAFDKMNWTTDPKESWDDLLRIRCLQLRYKYKNLRLLYSGGRDSHHILRTFTKNKIPVDELVLVNYIRNPIRTKEYHDWMLPMAHQYKQHNPQVKISTIVLGVDEYKKFYNETWTERSSATSISGFFQPVDFTWLIEEKLRVPDSSTGIVCGLEKPELVLIDNKIYSTMSDSLFQFYFANQSLMDFFYISPDLPELHVKQAWLMINYLKEHYPDADEDFFKKFQAVHDGYYDEFAISTGRGLATDVTCASQNGMGKYRGNHPVFQVLKKIIQEEAPMVWNRYQENLNFFRQNTPIAIYDCADSFWKGPKNIYSKQYLMSTWPVKN